MPFVAETSNKGDGGTGTSTDGGGVVSAFAPLASSYTLDTTYGAVNSAGLVVQLSTNGWAALATHDPSRVPLLGLTIAPASPCSTQLRISLRRGFISSICRAREMSAGIPIGLASFIAFNPCSETRSTIAFDFPEPVELYRPRPSRLSTRSGRHFQRPKWSSSDDFAQLI